MCRKSGSTDGSDRAHCPSPSQSRCIQSKLMQWPPHCWVLLGSLECVVAGQRCGDYGNRHVSSPPVTIFPSLMASHSCPAYNPVNYKPAIPVPTTDPLSRCHSSSRDRDPCVVPPTATGCRKTLERPPPVDMLTDPLHVTLWYLPRSHDPLGTGGTCADAGQRGEGCA